MKTLVVTALLRLIYSFVGEFLGYSHNGSRVYSLSSGPANLEPLGSSNEASLSARSADNPYIEPSTAKWEILPYDFVKIDNAWLSAVKSSLATRS